MELKITDRTDPDFLNLIELLDEELDQTCKEAHKLCTPFNSVDKILAVVLIYQKEIPVACGAFKQFDATTIEIKRVFVRKEYRGQGFSKMLISTLEQLGREKGYHSAILETGKQLKAANALYSKLNYRVIPNYGPYEKMEDSICLQKDL
jgi:GNAT superfamily N-acetyltransferase